MNVIDKAIKPFRRCYTVVDGMLWGGCYPGDRNTSAARAKLGWLLDCSVRVVINLMANERDRFGQPFVPYEEMLNEMSAAHCAQVDVFHKPIVDGSVPSPKEMHAILDLIDRGHMAGKPVFVHCWGGKGRTSLVMGCYLVRHGRATGIQAVKMVNEMRMLSGDPTARRPVLYRGRQRDFVVNWDKFEVLQEAQTTTPPVTFSPRERRNPQSKLLCDFHIHTNKVGLDTIVGLYGAAGFDAICITDHVYSKQRLKSKLRKGRSPDTLPV